MMVSLVGSLFLGNRAAIECTDDKLPCGNLQVNSLLGLHIYHSGYGWLQSVLDGLGKAGESGQM